MSLFQCPCGGTYIRSGNWFRCDRCGKDSTPEQVTHHPIGKLIICTVRERVPESVPADYHWLTVGKPKGDFYYKELNWIWKPALAPSRELVTFTKLHNRPGHKSGWFSRYKESLIEEWSIRGDTISAMQDLATKLMLGKDICVACYCMPEKRPVCHLSVLRDIVEDLGFLVEEAPPIKYK